MREERYGVRVRDKGEGVRDEGGEMWCEGERYGRRGEG